MATVAQPKLLTAEEFMEADLGEGRSSWSEGRLIEVPPRCRNTDVSVSKVGLCSGVVRPTDRVSDMPSRTTRPSLPSASPIRFEERTSAFYSHARWPRVARSATACRPCRPTWPSRSFSPSNRAGEILRKIDEYLEAGVSLVWVVYPSERRSGRSTARMTRSRRPRARTTSSKTSRASRLPLPRGRSLRLSPGGGP